MVDLNRSKPVARINKLLSNRFIDDSMLSDETSSCAFESFFGDFLENKTQEGEIIEGKVVKIENEDVIIDVNLKSEGRIPIKEFYVKNSLPTEITIGSKVRVYLEKIEGRNGNVILSREKAMRIELWEKLEEAFNTAQEIEGTIISQIKCGFSIDIEGISAFLPHSHVDIKQIDNAYSLIGTKQRLLILKMDKAQGNVVVSRKKILEAAHADAKAKFLDSLNEGDIIDGKVKSIASYGVFIGIHESNEVGVVDGLLHITHISWSRVSHPSTIFSLGQTVKVKIIEINRKEGRVSLGTKQLEQSPWDNIEEKYPIGSIHKGYVTNIAVRTQDSITQRREEYGAFVELSPGVEGLVHSTEITWKRSTLPASQLLKKGQEVCVKILNIDLNKNKMGLSIKKCIKNPLQDFASKHSLGSTIPCIVKDIVNYGIFVEFEDDQNVDGFIYTADLCWSKNYENEIKKYKIGDKIEAKIIKINTNKYRVNLGIKQLQKDPFEEFLNTVQVGDTLKAIVTKIEENGILVEVAIDVTVLVEWEHLPENKKFHLGEKINVKVTGTGTYSISLSCK